MKPLLTFLALTSPLLAQPCAEKLCGPFSSATNYTVDLAGSPDTRAATWGSVGYQTWRIPFHPPTGYRVRILSITGDLTAWAHGVTPPGSSVGVLWGLQTTGAMEHGLDSKRVDYSSDGTMLYVQGALSSQPLVRSVTNMDVSAGGLLDADNVLVCKVAIFLSDLGMPSIHLEPTWTMKYRWERIE